MKGKDSEIIDKKDFVCKENDMRQKSVGLFLTHSTWISIQWRKEFWSFVHVRKERQRKLCNRREQTQWLIETASVNTKEAQREKREKSNPPDGKMG